MKKIIFIPNGNTFCHTLQSLAIADLLKDVYSISFMISGKRAPFISDQEYETYVIPEPWEVSGSPYLDLEYFQNPEYLKKCVIEEYNIIKRIQPDLVIGNFKFTTKISTLLSDKYYISLNNACMLPYFKDTWGFNSDSNSESFEDQKKTLDFFDTYNTLKVNKVLEDLNLPLITGYRELLLGNFNILWDIPEFQPMDEMPGNLVYAGPLFWNGWKKEYTSYDLNLDSDKKTVYLSFGTVFNNRKILYYIIDALKDLDLNIIITTGLIKNSELKDLKLMYPDYIITDFLPPNLVIGKSDLVISHGGHATILQTLSLGCPLLLFPTQPEQAQNSMRVEDLGCGISMIDTQIFIGGSDIYFDRILKLNQKSIFNAANKLMNNNFYKNNCTKMKKILSKYNGPKTSADIICKYLEGKTDG